MKDTNERESEYELDEEEEEDESINSAQKQYVLPDDTSHRYFQEGSSVVTLDSEERKGTKRVRITLCRPVAEAEGAGACDPQPGLRRG